MTLTVFFDLDDTLLTTNMGDFLPAYFNGLGKALTHLGSQETITEQIRFAVGKMVANQDPTKYLRDVFAENFYPALGTTETKCQEKLTEFYTKSFPKLQAVVQQKPEAGSLIQWCKSEGMRLAITTNPLFPETATRQRIVWAGLDPQDFLFFSTYDNFHFTKPNFTYYAEAIGRSGWPEGPIVMVGDNLTHDLVPVEEMGLHSFWINPEVDSTGRPHGSLTDVKRFLANHQTNIKQLTLTEDPEVTLAVLRSTPAVLSSWLETYDRKALHQQPTDGEWSANQVFWHLADFEERVYQPQWEHLLRKPDEIIPHVETSHWDETRGYASREPEAAVQRFLECRLASLEMIEALFEKGFFEIQVRHTVFSNVKISELVHFSARHDRMHLRQSAEALKI